MKSERNIDPSSPFIPVACRGVLHSQIISDQAVSEVRQGIPLSATAASASATADVEPSCTGSFTLLEVMIAMALFGLVMAGTIEVYIICNKLWHATSLSMETSRMASLAIQRMVYGLGTNCGLRSAASVSVDMIKHKEENRPCPNYWDTLTNSPPAANSSANDLCLYPWSHDPDGSWRITYSNAFDGVKYIDYIKLQRSIVMWENINNSASRLLICNYVLDTAVSNTSEGVTIGLTVWKKDGMFVSSNQVSMFVKMRNKF